MNIKSRMVTGILMVIFGIFLILFVKELILLFIYAIPIIIIGFIIFFNKKEDDIEKIKTKGGKK
jgi:ABC-type bacteriocin/lantibiotic exporter with double-glycine peptidase domain